MMNKYLILLLSVFLTSCVQLSFEDVSDNPEYNMIIGKKLKTADDLWAISITTDKNYKKITDYIVLVPGVGFSGPEVVSRERLEKGTILEITKILKSTSLFSNKLLYVVELDNGKYSDIQVRIKVSGSIKSDNYGLNSSVFYMVANDG